MRQRSQDKQAPGDLCPPAPAYCIDRTGPPVVDMVPGDDRGRSR
jgi:hypothetical protein